MTTRPPQPSRLNALRAVMPPRSLTTGEAYQVAERQATKLLTLSDVTTAPVPESVIAELPRFSVERRSGLPISGYTQWKSGRWQIVLSADEALVRSRFSLFHEAKHAIDHPFIGQAYRRMQSPKAFAETICDYFAACVLMPKAWVKRTYCDEGVQDLGQLARRFGVSRVAMRYRLQQLGLMELLPRCRYGRSGPVDTWELAVQPEVAAA